MTPHTKFDYGDEALLRGLAPSGESVRRPCSVVGITKVETEKQAEVFGFPRGTTLYTVEFGDGSDKLVSENDLEPVATGG
jgi:hypothetical protein